MDSLSGDFESEAEGTGLNRADPQARGFHDEGSIGSKPFEQSSERTDTLAKSWMIFQVFKTGWDYRIF
jgi:hypothetical protein